MCVLCEGSGQAAEFSVTSRPAHRLCGLRWSSADLHFARTDLQSTIARVAAFSATRSSVWKSPLVGLSRLEPGGHTYFVGVDIDEASDIPEEFVFFDVPEMTLVSAWHGTPHGSIEDRYLAMAGWVGEHGYTTTSAVCERREEYPHDTNGSAEFGLRLMVPIFRQFD